MNEDRAFSGGRADPEKYGHSLRGSAGGPPDPAAIEAVAALLGRPPFLIDEEGYERELIAAARHPSSGAFAYVESRAKELGELVDVSIKIHSVDGAGAHRAIDIESYNPFFGCDVRLFEWRGAWALLIYREKHKTYACTWAEEWPPRFVPIEDRWSIEGDELVAEGRDGHRRRWRLPELAAEP